MFDDLGILIYLDEILVRNINSIQGGFYGYIDIRSKKSTVDIGLCDREKIQKNDTLFLEERCNRDKREGFKGYGSSDAETKTVSTGFDGGREQSANKRCEESVTQIYTAYVYHLDFYRNLSELGKIVNFQSTRRCSQGDYVHISGMIEENSVLSYVDSLLLIIEIYGEKKIEFLLKNTELEGVCIKKALIAIKTAMEKNGIVDLILNDGVNRFILQINNSYFFNNNCCSTSNIGCNVNVVGKVTGINNGNGMKLSLIRKLDQREFYEEILRKIDRVFRRINIGVTIPMLGELNIDNCIHIIPLSIFV